MSPNRRAMRWGGVRRVRNGQVLRKDRERIHQDGVMPSESDAALYGRQVGLAEEAFARPDRLCIYLRCRRDDTSRVELYLVGRSAYGERAGTHVPECFVIGTRGIPVTYLYGEKVLYGFFHISVRNESGSSRFLPGVPRYGCGLCTGCGCSSSRYPVKHRSCLPSGGTGRPRRRHGRSDSSGRS